MEPLPLEGIRVLDLSRVLAGPMAAMMLGDLGAHVIKVERPGQGDDTRGWGPPFTRDGQAAYFVSANRNKLSVAADLADPDHLGLVLRLIAAADIVLDNFLPGVLARKKIDADALLAQFPQLVWCTISGFGADSHRPGYDFVVQAESGWMAITGEPAGAPMRVGVALADVIAGKDVVISALAALVARDRAAAAGRPLSADARRRHVALSASALAALVNVAQNALVTGEDAIRWGNAHPNLVPYQLFPAMDQPVVIAVGSDAQWQAVAQALDLTALAADPALATNAGRLAQRSRVVTAITHAVANLPAAVCVDQLRRVGVPCGVVRSVRDALREAAVEPALAEATGMPSSVQGRVRYKPPALDEHGALIRTYHWSAFDHVPILTESGL